MLKTRIIPCLDVKDGPHCRARRGRDGRQVQVFAAVRC
jgi:imidazole glycerol phosphate synthase subunit HisF